MPSGKNISEKQKEKKKTYKKNTFKNVDPCHLSVFVIYFEQAIAYWDTQKQKDLQTIYDDSRSIFEISHRVNEKSA